MENVASTTTSGNETDSAVYNEWRSQREKWSAKWMA